MFLDQIDLLIFDIQALLQFMLSCYIFKFYLPIIVLYINCNLILCA